MTWQGWALVAGVIDTTSNYVEHPEVVADRLARADGDWKPFDRSGMRGMMFGRGRRGARTQPVSEQD